MTRGRARKNGLDSKLLSLNEKKGLDSKDVDVECGLNDHRRVKHEMKHPKNMKQATRPVEDPTSLNVNKADVHKERWREDIYKVCVFII